MAVVPFFVSDGRSNRGFPLVDNEKTAKISTGETIAGPIAVRKKGTTAFFWKKAVVPFSFRS
jgi:hypothetical protein